MWSRGLVELDSRKPNRHIFLLGCVVFVLCLLGLGVFKLLSMKDGPGSSAPSGGAKASPVAVTKPEPYLFSDAITVLGVAKARQGITLTSNSTEMVAKVLFADGARVAKGQVLIELQARQETAAVSQVQANLTLANLNYKRWKELADQGIAARARADEALAALQVQEAQYRQASAQQQDRVIRAPFSGIMGLSDVAPGALITPGTAIASLDDVAVIRVDLQVPDRYLARLHQGMSVNGVTEAFAGKVWTGHISKLDTRIQDATRAIVARAEFANPDQSLRPGMMMQVSLDGGSRSGLSLPETAVQFEGNEASVFVVNSNKGPDGKPKATVSRRQITVGLTQNGQVEIRDGIKATDLVVKDGLSRLQDGMAVRPVDKASDHGQPGPGMKPVRDAVTAGASHPTGHP